MFELFLLGSPRIDGKAGRLAGEPAQRHRLALLALLATARDATLPREKVMALLWPERGDRDARHLLNVSVHVLRKALGDDVLRTEGDALRLNTDVLRCDIVQFRVALQSGAEADAIAAYGGTFLDGFYLDGAPEFDQWLEAERARIAGEYLDAMEQSAHRSEEAGDWTAALRWWQAIVALVPDRPRAVVRLMRVLEATGDRAGGLRAADAHVALLAKEYGAEPSPEVLALASRMRALPAEVSVASFPPNGAAAGADAPRLTSTVPGGRRSARWLGAAALVLLSAATVLSLAPWREAEEPSVAVLPFLDLSPGKDRMYLSDGLTDEILNALAKVPGLRVASRSSAFQFRDEGVDVREVGRRLQVGAIVEGSVRVDSNRLRVTAQLIETKRGYHLWSQNYDRDFNDVFTVQEDIARMVATALGDELLEDLTRPLVARGTHNTDAYDLYLRGRHEWNRRTTDGMWAALEAFQEATTLDPQFASAYAGLSDTWQLLPDYGNVPARDGLARAKTAALRAIALDSTLAEAYASLGAIYDDYDHHRKAAEDAYRRAILLNPKYATARQWLAIHLADEGRAAEAAEEIERARRLDPLSRIINTAVGAVRYFARDYASAVAEYHAVLDQHPQFALAWALMGRVYLVRGDVDSAVTALRRSVDMSGGDPSYRAVYAAALAAAGERVAADSIARELLNAAPGYVPFCELASAFIYLGDSATALGLFQRAVEERDPALKHLAVEPLYDQIRANARFRALLQRVGLGAVPNATSMPAA